VYNALCSNYPYLELIMKGKNGLGTTKGGMGMPEKSGLGKSKGRKPAKVPTGFKAGGAVKGKKGC
jgi:hypothetical protein